MCIKYNFFIVNYYSKNYLYIPNNIVTKECVKFTLLSIYIGIHL